MKAVAENENRPSELAVVAPLLPLLMAPLLNLPLQSRLPSPSLRALVVTLIVLALALGIALVLRALRLRPMAPRQLGPAGMAISLSALCTVAVYVASSLMS